MKNRELRSQKVQAGRELDLGVIGRPLEEVLCRMAGILENETSPTPLRVALHVPTPDLVEVPSLIRDGLAPQLGVPNARAIWITRDRDVQRMMNTEAHGARNRIAVISFAHLSYASQSQIVARTLRDRSYVIVLIPHRLEYYSCGELWTPEFALGCDEVVYPLIETRVADFPTILERALGARGAHKDVHPRALETLKSLPITSPRYGVETIIAIAERLAATVQSDVVTEEDMWNAIAATLPEANLAPPRRPSSPPPRRSSQQIKAVQPRD